MTLFSRSIVPVNKKKGGERDEKQGKYLIDCSKNVEYAGFERISAGNKKRKEKRPDDHTHSKSKE